MARRNDHSREELREMALQAAESLLDASGPAGVSMRRIAASIGYTHGTLYLIFENLDALLTQLNARTLAALVAALEQAAAAEAGRPRLLALAEAYHQFARDHTARWRLVFEHHPPESVDGPAESAHLIQEGFALLTGALPRAATGPEELGAAFWAAVHGVVVLALDDKLIDANGDVLDPRVLLQRVVEVFLLGASAPAAA